MYPDDTCVCGVGVELVWLTLDIKIENDHQLCLCDSFHNSLPYWRQHKCNLFQVSYGSDEELNSYVAILHPPHYGCIHL